MPCLLTDTPVVFTAADWKLLWKSRLCTLRKSTAGEFIVLRNRKATFAIPATRSTDRRFG